jgi:hypothetical protein
MKNSMKCSLLTIKNQPRKCYKSKYISLQKDDKFSQMRQQVALKFISTYILQLIISDVDSSQTFCTPNKKLTSKCHPDQVKNLQNAD